MKTKALISILLAMVLMVQLCGCGAGKKKQDAVDPTTPETVVGPETEENADRDATQDDPLPADVVAVDIGTAPTQATSASKTEEKETVPVKEDKVNPTTTATTPVKEDKVNPTTTATTPAEEEKVNPTTTVTTPAEEEKVNPPTTATAPAEEEVSPSTTATTPAEAPTKPTDSAEEKNENKQNTSNELIPVPIAP